MAKPRTPEQLLRSAILCVALQHCGNPSGGRPCRECATITRDTLLSVLDGLPVGYRSMPAMMLATAVRKACGDA